MKNRYITFLIVFFSFHMQLVAMPIYVNISGRTITLNVEATDAISDVKMLIETSESIPSSQQVLTFNSVELSNAQTLADYNVQRESTLYLSVSVPVRSYPKIGPNGIVVPNFTETDRLAIASPDTGLMVYQTDGTTGYYVYTGSTWVRLLDSNTSIGGGASTLDDLTDAKSGGANFTNSLIIGHQSSGILSSASSNTGVGINALKSLTSGINNTALGTSSMEATTSGTRNTSIGSFSMLNNTTGYENVAIGNYSLQSNTSGTNNVGIGVYSLYANETGEGNVAIGRSSLYTLVNGSYNTAIGYDSNVSEESISNSTAIGNGAIVDADNKIQLGNTSVTAVATSGSITAGAVTYPNTDGTNGQVLSTNGSGALSWATPSATVPNASLTSAKFYARTISESTTLTSNDFIVIANGAVTISLPSSPADGQVYLIVTNNIATTISSNVSINYGLTSSSTSVDFSSLKTKIATIIYSQTIGSWFVTVGDSPATPDPGLGGNGGFGGDGGF
jgi:hypothetical protein